MATQQSFLVGDNSTLANFKSWGSTLSAWMATAGWLQSADTGQVNWSTVATVPSSSAFVYEIWEPNDSLTNFYLKIEYGTSSNSSTTPSLRISIGTGTNGAGTLTGFVTTPIIMNQQATTPSATTTYECDFSGAAGRIGAMMWRNAPSGHYVNQMFAVERSLNSSGAYTGTYVTLYFGGPINSASGNSAANFSQQTVYFGVGVAPFPAGGSGLQVRGVNNNASGVSSSVSTSFNGAIPLDMATPCVGFYDYAGTAVGSVWGADVSEGVTFTATLYGTSHTFMPSKAGAFGTAGPSNWSGYSSSAYAVCMRYD